jgi:Mg-chelatase subunit ChlD
MNWSTSIVRITVAGAACACMALSWPGCNKLPPEVGGSTGVGGQYEGTEASGGAGGGGSTRNGDASTITLDWDALSSPKGGSGGTQDPDAASTPTADSNCGNIRSKTTRQPVDVLLVLDRSGSMDFSITENCYCTSDAVTRYGSLCSDTTNCTTRWSAVKPALATTLSSSKYVNWGLKFFPSAGAGTSCTENSTMEVPIPTVAGSSTANIQTQVDGIVYEYSTPTATALNAATTYLKGLDDGNQKFILLATDGVPNCGGTPANVNTDDLKGANAAAAAAAAAGYKVYVIGIGPNLASLTQLAQNGGTTDFYQISSPQDLADKLSSISKLMGSCSFKSDSPPPDVKNVAVYVNGAKVDQDASNGWTFGAGTQEVVLTGDYCAKMSTGDEVDVQILFGCPGQTYFPPTIY